MEDKSSDTRTTKEKRIDKISQLKAQIQKEQAKLKEEARKERNGQLIAFGIYMEEYLKANPSKISSMKQSMQNFLDGRNLDRALSGLERISETGEKNENHANQKCNIEN